MTREELAARVAVAHEDPELLALAQVLAREHYGDQPWRELASWAREHRLAEAVLAVEALEARGWRRPESAR